MLNTSVSDTVVILVDDLLWILIGQLVT